MVCRVCDTYDKLGVILDDTDSTNSHLVLSTTGDRNDKCEKSPGGEEEARNSVHHVEA